MIKGDAKCLAVAAASCVAKVTRDGMMREEAEHFPPYDFESNVGYPAPAHKTALAGYGPSAIHRRSWIFMDSLCWRGRAPCTGAAVHLALSQRRGGCDMSVDLPEIHARALDGTRRSIAGVSDDQWPQPSVCDGWTVRELVNHIVTGNYWAAELGSGFTIEAVGDRLDGDVLGTDPLRTYDDSVVGGGGGVPRARCDGSSRARCRTARSPGRSTAGTGSSTC